MMNVVVTDKPFDPEVAHKAFRESMGDIGAMVTFTGLVREENEISVLILSHYPGFTEDSLATIGAKVAERWSLLGWHITHRVGALSPKEPIVFVATAAKHRRDAFEAANFLMDYLKSEAPFWKQEQRGDETIWIEPREQDLIDIERWKR